MSILGTANYIIEHRSDRSVAPPEAIYVDNFENLRRAIATTWSRIPHRVKVEGMTVQVFGAPLGELLADFEFKALPTAKIPEHL